MVAWVVSTMSSSRRLMMSERLTTRTTNRAQTHRRRGGDECPAAVCGHDARQVPWDADRVTPEDLAHLRRARDLMDREYTRPLDVPAMARVALMSPAHFARQFRAAYGETPYGYLMTRRIERAKALLRRGDLTVTEVCMAVGCTSLGSFSSRFTDLVDGTPSAYRVRNHDAGAAVPACYAKIVTRPSRFREAPVASPA